MPGAAEVHLGLQMIETFVDFACSLRGVKKAIRHTINVDMASEQLQETIVSTRFEISKNYCSIERHQNSLCIHFPDKRSELT